MFFDYKTYLYCLYFLIFKKKPTLRSIIALFFLVIQYPILNCFIKISYLLDNIFFYPYRLQKIESPVFIVGMPRSGTTFLFRLMCKDEKKFAYFKLYQVLFPSLCIQKSISLMSSIDSLLNRNLSRFITKCEKESLKGYKDLHKFGLTEPEEDDGLFIHCFFTPLIYLFLPFMEEFRRISFFDKNLEKKKKKQFIKFYSGFIKRQLYAFGKNRIFLSKNVWGLGKLKTLKEQFPDGKFIYIIRHPYESIGSLLSYYYKLLQILDPDISISPELSKKVAEIACDLHIYANEILPQFPKNSLIVIKYDDLINQLQETVTSIYKHCNIPIDQSFATYLDKEDQKSKEYSSPHQYSLEKYGVSKDLIHKRMHQIFERYNFQS